MAQLIAQVNPFADDATELHSLCITQGSGFTPYCVELRFSKSETVPPPTPLPPHCNLVYLPRFTDFVI